MSAFTCIKLAFKDKECLKESLKEIGFTEVEEYEEAQPLMGYQGDRRAQKANIIIRKQHVGRASNDVGFIKNKDGSYDMIISDYDRKNPLLNDKLKQTYGLMSVRKQMKRRGYIISSQKTDAQGRIKLKVMVG